MYCRTSAINRLNEAEKEKMHALPNETPSELLNTFTEAFNLSVSLDTHALCFQHHSCGRIASHVAYRELVDVAVQHYSEDSLGEIRLRAWCCEFSD